MQAQYRNVHEPILKLIGALQRQSGHRRIAILIPEIVKQRWYPYLLHANHARHLPSQLLQRGGRQRVVVSVPWRRHALDG